MGNFLVTIASPGAEEQAERAFLRGLGAAKELSFPEPLDTIKSPLGSAAIFPRRNGAGSRIARDAGTGSWLLAIGSWFHESGCASGEDEKLLARYGQVGALRLARELEGFFVLVIADAPRAETVVITDVVGSCHAFERAFGPFAAISGSSLLLAALGNAAPDLVGCQEFLRTGIIYEDRTFFREVRKLGPARVYRLGKDAPGNPETYWRTADIAADSLRDGEACETLWHSLARTATRVGKAFERPVCDLTGGYDSRATVAAFSGAGVHFATAVSGPADSPDVVISRGLAEMAGLPNVHFPPRECVAFAQVSEALPYTDGEADLVDYSRVLGIHKRLAADFDVSINGSFGEVARGYWWELLFPRTGAHRPLDAEKLARLRYAATASNASLFPPASRLDLVPHFTGIIERTTAGLAQLPNTMQMDYSYLAMRMQRWQGRLASSTNRLWPCISPFMFRSSLEAMLRADFRLRRRSLLIRRMLTEFAPRWSEYPLEHGHPAAPLRFQNAHRFLPLLRHFGSRAISKAVRMAGLSKASHSSGTDPLSPRAQLWAQEEVREILDPRTMKTEGILDRVALSAFLARSQAAGFDGDGQWTRLLSLEYTLRRLARLSDRQQ